MKKISIFSLSFLLIGFLARSIDGWSADAQTPGPGQLIWLISPLALALLFTFLFKQKNKWGFNPQITTSWHWYVMAFLFLPSLSLLLIAIGIQLGAVVKLKPLLTQSLFYAIGMSIPIYFIKNIFEEFVWRGYLYSQLEKQNITGLQNHLIIGFIWVAWHLPYLDAFNRIYHDMAWYVYGPLFFVGVMLTSIIYGEVRRRSGTVWTAVILHTMGNAVVNTLFIEEHIQLVRSKAWWVAPSIDNLGYIFLVGFFAFLLYKMDFKTQHRSRTKL